MLITKGHVNTVLQPSPVYWGQSPKRVYFLMPVAVPVFLNVTEGPCEEQDPAFGLKSKLKYRCRWLRSWKITAHLATPRSFRELGIRGAMAAVNSQRNLSYLLHEIVMLALLN